MAEKTGPDTSKLVAIIADEVSGAMCFYRLAIGSPELTALREMQDTITGFLLAGVGNVDLRRKSNFLVVDSSELYSEEDTKRWLAAISLPHSLRPLRAACTMQRRQQRRSRMPSRTSRPGTTSLWL